MCNPLLNESFGLSSRMRYETYRVGGGMKEIAGIIIKRWDMGRKSINQREEEHITNVIIILYHM